MANGNDQRDNRDNERMGRGVHEGLNAGQSRNAHDSGSRSSSGGSSGGSSGSQADGNDQGRGGYGNDTGFTGGSRASEDALSDATDESRGMKAAPGSSGAHTEDTSRSDGVGHQASSGMDEHSSSAEPR